LHTFMPLHPGDGGGQSLSAWHVMVHFGPFALKWKQRPLWQSSFVLQSDRNGSLLLVLLDVPPLDVPPEPPDPPAPPPPAEAAEPGSEPQYPHAPYASFSASHAAKPGCPSAHVHASKSPS
jgi:hypothetical protein